MGEKIVRVSDVSGVQADPQSFGTLTINVHPGYQNGLPVELDALPDEVKDLFGDDVALVLGEYRDPDGTVTRFAVPADVFNGLSENGMNAPMMDALGRAAQQRRQAKKAAPRRAQRSRVNYASLEHAGEPHRGRITEEEQRIVREHLDEVNERLREKGMRVIDPDDPQMAERYGL